MKVIYQQLNLRNIAMLQHRIQETGNNEGDKVYTPAEQGPIILASFLEARQRR